MSNDAALDYLRGTLTAGRDLAPEVQAMTRTMAKTWREQGVDPALLELTAELLARVAAELGGEVAGFADVEPVLVDLELPPPLLHWLQAGLSGERNRAQLAALAVHLVDIAEMMALDLFVPELPRLAAKSDRTGDAARNVGVARHLRG